MSVTWEQARLLQKQYASIAQLSDTSADREESEHSFTYSFIRLGFVRCARSFYLSADLVTQCTEQMRVIGVRRENAFKNIGMFNVCDRVRWGTCT